MKVGTAADVITEGAMSRRYAGKITRTSNAVDPKARTLQVEIDIPNHDGSLVPGLYVDTAFHLESGGTAEIPAAALLFRAKGPQVAVVEGEHVAFRDVTIAQDNGTTVALGSGVKDGDKVVLNISSRLPMARRSMSSMPTASGRRARIVAAGGKMTRFRRIAVAAALLGVLGGLHRRPDYQPPKPDLPKSFAAVAPDAKTTAVDETRWWESFHDPS